MQCGLPVQYVMDEMEMYEWEIYTSHHQLKTKEEWEQTRFLSYMIANNNPFRKKELPMKTIMTFPWDDDNDENRAQLTDQQVEEMRARARQFEEYVRSNNNGEGFSYQGES